MAFNPFKDGGATEVVEDFDPFKDGGATKVVEEFDPFKNSGATELDSPEPTQNYFVDKAKRLGQSLAQVPGQFVESVGQMADATGRGLASSIAAQQQDELNAPGDARQAAINQALRTPTPGIALIRDTGREMRQTARDLYKGNYAPDPARDTELGSKVAGSTGSLVASLITPGGLVTKTTTGALINSLGQSDEARQKMLQRGATEQDADDEGLRQFVLNLPAGALEAVPWEAALKRFGGTKIADAVAQKYGKTALRRISTAVFGQAATEAGEEALQNLWGNAAAKLTYDPTRAVTEGTGEAALVGGIMGAGFGGTAQTTAEIASALDTRQNLAESKKTLLAQQQQLVRGLRAAQMFPVDADGKVTNELPLPPEMARVVTERGVFHYNPAKIDEATLLKLSGVGRENGPLALGSQSKADVAARVAQGDPAVTVTERQPDGTEVKASVATLGTANQTAAELAASKTPGNTVQVESLGQVVTERTAAAAAPNFIEGMLAADAAAATATREAAAKEEAGRTERQTELAEKKARFEERLAVARQTLADPAASFPAVDGALTSLTSYAEDRSIGLTQTQREQALAAQAALQKRHALLAPDAAAAADAAAATRRTEAKLAEDVKTEKVRRERTTLQHLETTGRDLATGEITDLTNVPDEELAALDANAEGLTPAQIDAEQQRRGEQAERTAATANDAGYTLRDLIFGKKAALAAAGQRSALRLKSPAALSLEGGTMAGEHRALGERQGGFKIFSDTGLAEDGLQERLQSLGFDAPDVTAAYALYERALAGEEIRPERGSGQQVDFAAPAATPGPILTETQVAEEFAALRREFPALTRDLDLRSGLVADELKARGYTGPVPPGVQAAILKLQQEKRLLVIAAKAAQEGKASGLFLHEMAHPFFDALPSETKTILRELHAQEMATATGPLFNADGQLLTDVKVRAADFPASRLRADPDLPVKEWFAERVRALNADWLAGRTPRDHSTMLRVWRELLAKLRTIFAQVRGLDPDSDLFTTTFRRWLDMGGKADLTAAGLAYATRQEAEFASRQETMDLGSTPLGVTLPNEIRNLAPRWQDKTLQFDSSLDKALYYAGGTPGALRERIVDDLGQQTGLSAGEIATLARELRQRLAPLARPTASNATVRVPAQMQSAVRQITAVNFATGEAEFAKAFDQAAEDFYQSARDSVATDPERISAEDTAKRSGEILTPAQAAARLNEWKALAAKEGQTGQHQAKTILSLFDSTGVWSRPWLEAGFNVVQIDQKIVAGDGYEMDVMKVNQDWLVDNGLDMVHGVLAACPCTEFAGSGARWFKIKDADGRTKKAAQLVNHTLAIIEYLQPDGFWAIENPIGRLKQQTEIPLERLQFQPHNYGDPYTKRTQIYGSFDAKLPQANVEPTEGSFSWNLSGNRENSKAERSKTFEGFAYAFFAANYQRNALAEIDAKIRRDNANDQAYAARAGQPAPQGQQATIDFATGPATRATVSKVSKKNDYLRVGTSRLGTDAVPLTTPATSNIHGKMVPAELLAKQMPYVNYPHLPQDIRGEQNPVVKRDKFVAWMKSNLLALYKAFPADVRARATQWYDGANTIATDFSKRFGTTLEQASGVLAVLSPQKDWFMNVAQAEQVMDIWKNHQKTVITEALVREQLEDIISGALATPGSKRTGQPDESPLAKTRRRNANARLDQAAKDARRKVLQRIIGKTVQQLEAKPNLQGWAIRILAQSIHGREFRIISPEGDAMGVVTKKNGKSRKNGWGSISEIKKAVRILKNGSLTNISDNLGAEHKVRNFYNNIVAPNTPFGDATMDTHAVAAAHIMPFGSSALEVKHNFGIRVPGSGPLGVSGIYHLYIDAYTDAAKELGLLPRQLQSITWEAIRQLYSAESRRDKNVIAAATAKWKTNTNGNARAKLLGNGISRPTWAGATNDAQPQGKPARLRRGRDSDDTGGGLRFRGRDGAGGGLDQAGFSVDFATANSASEYVATNGTPPAKVAAARADIERILGVVQDDQLDFVSYTRGGRLVLRSGPSAAGSANERPGAVLGAAEALKAPNQPDVVRAAYGIDPADPGNTGSERISSIIPALIADPKRTWDIRGAQITTARDVMTLVTVLRSPYVEIAKIILLNRAGVVVHSEIIGIGALSAAIVDSTQLAGVLNRAPQTDEGYDVILSHNHPGGNPAPSPGDYTVTRALRGLLSRTKHNLRDHVVTNGDTYYSYAENKWPVPSGRDPRTGQPLPPWYAMGAPSAVTTQPPTARGADADTRIEPGSAAPWEIVRRNDLYTFSSSANTLQLIDSLRQVDPTALHIIYLNRKYLVTALERVPNFKAAPATQAGWRPWEPLTSKLLEGFGREGAAAFMLFAPDTMTSRDAKNLMREMAELSERSDFIFLDYAAQQLTVGNTARGLGLMEPGPSVDFATGPEEKADAKPKPNLATFFRTLIAHVDRQLAALENSQEDAADIEARGKVLTAERARLQGKLAEWENTLATAAAVRPASEIKATIDVRHPASVAIPSEPGDAWAMAPQMTDGELAAERDSITQHIHDQGDGLAPAMRAHLNARLNALSTEQHRRGTPLGTAVVALPQIDRQAALVAELTRGRALAADGNRTGNDAALNEGNRLVRLAKARLDEEFPGWDATPAPATKAAATQPPLPPEPPTTEAAPASEGDGEQSPFSGSEEETMPVRPGKWSEVYGHSSYTPSFLLKTWRRISAVLTGIRGPIPELPTFPAARWNKSDPFIAEHGPQFYARIAEGERALKSANDYLQRTAADQIGAIIEPVLKAEGKFSAEDYAQLRAFQEQARRTQADGKPLPPSLTAGIAALNSKMESSPYVLFNRLVFALDLHWRVQNLKDSAGNAIVLPAGINAAETKAELARLSALLAASPHAALIQTAITAHRALVAQVAEDLKSRELLAADHLANPYYFPHLTLETTQGGKIEQRELTPARVRPGTEADFRGYLETPVGSKKAIEQDYVRAMYYHLVQVGAHNFKADAVRDYFRPYDIKATVERRAKELTKERGVPVTWEQAFNEEFAPRGYVKYGTDSRDAFPTLTINRDLLARRLGVMLTSGDLHAQLKELNQTGVKLLPEDIRESLTQGERETWIVPSRVAEALRGIGDRLSAQDNAVEAAAKWTLQVWKSWKLFMPMSHIRYEYGNIVADSEKLFSGSPGTFKYLPIAAKELRAFWLGGKPSTDLQAALKDGVLNAITAQELDSLVRIKAFEAFETRSQKAWDMVKRRGSSILYQPATAALGLGEFSTPELSALREAITRYAHYQANLEAIRAGARPAYGGAYWKNIEAMTDSRPGANDAAERKAAAISKATFGDYGDLSVLGQTARDKFVPFYSWMEINFRYHANLLRNLRDMVREGDTPAAAQAGKTVALAGLSFTARAAGGLALRLALPYLALALWNNSGDRDELEKLLSEEDRRRTHLILGRDAQGKVLVVYGNTALMDVMKWISGPKFAQAMGGWLNGKTDFATAAATWRDAILPDLANNTAGSFGPYFKIPYTLASGKAVFPDITDQKTIPAYDMRRAIIGQITDDFTADLIERTVNKDYYGSKDLGDWAKQLIMQVRQRDPESWAFYSIKDKANDYLEKRTGTKRDSSLDAPDQQVLRNFRRAIYRGDVDKAVQFYQRLLDYGYTAERFQASIRSQDPLSALPKENGLRKQFVDSLNPDDRAQLDRAYVFYQRMNASRGQERQLFPSQSSGFNGQMRYQAQPRTDLLRAQMQRVDGMSDEEREQRAQRDERRSLQRTN